MIEAPVIVTTEEMHYAALHQVVPVGEIQKVMGPALQEVMAAVLAQGMSPAGPWFTHHFHKPLATFDFEVCVPVANAIESSGRVQPMVWPAMKVARAVYHGKYAELPHAWGVFGEWVQANSGNPGTEFWEVYTVNPKTESDPAKWRTELNWPLLD